MDKQIIINGVDVSGCEFYKNTNWKNCYSRDYKESVCQSNPNCHYKQLKRKEQECERLRFPMQNTNYAILAKEEFEEYKKLKQTLTEIKEIAEHCIKQDICTTCDNSDKCHIEDEEIPTYDVCKLILQKISEVEDESNN